MLASFRAPSAVPLSNGRGALSGDRRASSRWCSDQRHERRLVGLAAVGIAGAHRSPREKVARPVPRTRQGRRNAKVLLNNLVSKTLRRSLLAGDVVYEVYQAADVLVATVRVYGLEEDDTLEFAGSGKTQKEAELRAAEAALAALPAAPEVAPRYPKPQAAAAWVANQLQTVDSVELDSTMADVLPTLAHVTKKGLKATASFILEEDPCRVLVQRDQNSSSSLEETKPELVRSILVSRKTEGGKLGAAMRARLLGEGGLSYEVLELKMAGKSACREAAIATKILQRFFPEELGISFAARFEEFEGYRALGLVLTVVKSSSGLG